MIPARDLSFNLANCKLCQNGEGESHEKIRRDSLKEEVELLTCLFGFIDDGHSQLGEEHHMLASDLQWI